MLDLGVYPVSLVQMALGVPLKQSALGRLTDSGVDMGDVVVGQYEDALSVATCQMDGASSVHAILTFEKGTIEMAQQFYRPTTVTLTVHSVDPDTGQIISSSTEDWDAVVPGGFQYEAAEAARRITAGDLESPVVPWSATLEVHKIMNDALEQVGVRYPQF